MTGDSSCTFKSPLLPKDVKYRTLGGYVEEGETRGQTVPGGSRTRFEIHLRVFRDLVNDQ